jgi:hypothetical protein
VERIFASITGRVVVVAAVAGVVVIDDVDVEVVKTWSAPTAVPPTLVATSRKWYVVFGVKFVTLDETELALDPVPASADAVFDPYEDVVPNWKTNVASVPFGLTAPLSVAVVPVTEPTVDDVVAPGGAYEVVNVSSGPSAVPPAFHATSCTW